MTQKVRVKDKDPTVKTRPFVCGECGQKVQLVEMKCPHCGAWFNEGWRDDTGDEGKE